MAFLYFMSFVDFFHYHDTAAIFFLSYLPWNKFVMFCTRGKIFLLHFLQEAVAVSPDSQKNGLSREEFLSFYKELTTRPEVYFLLARFVCTVYLVRLKYCSALLTKSTVTSSILALKLGRMKRSLVSRTSVQSDSKFLVCDSLTLWVPLTLGV